jgi:FkbM family methyltransferase
MNASWDGFTYTLDDPSFAWHINNGMSEPYPRELSIVKDYLTRYPSRNNTFIDVGGHIGTTSLPYSRLFKTVIAFEPNTVSYNFFKANIALNKCTNVSVTHKGVLNRNGFCKVVKHGDNSGCFYIKDCSADEESAVEVTKLDDIDYVAPVDFIKIDTEGSELRVLEGAQSILSTYHPLVQVETNHCSSTYFGYEKQRIYEFLKSLDYQALADDGNNPLFYHTL